MIRSKEKRSEEPWQLEIKYKRKLQLEESKFIFEQAEKSFNDSIETSKKIFDRSSSLLTLIAGVLIGLVAYSINRWEKDHTLDSLLTTAIIAIFYYLMVSLIFIFPNVKPSEYILPGTQPKRYFNDELFDAKPPQGRLTLLYMIEIKNIQDGLDANNQVNKKRWEIYRRSLNLIFYSPIVLVIIYLTLRLFIS